MQCLSNLLWTDGTGLSSAVVATTAQGNPVPSVAQGTYPFDANDGHTSY